MPFLRYITHPQVQIDLTRPVETWQLSELGRERAGRIALQPWAASLRRLVCSAEAKAIETARILGAALALEPEVRPAIGENDRSATGPLPPAEFERLASEFFARPDERVRGWESAREAQQRTAAGLDDLLDPAPDGDVAVVGHGGVGTLWFCHLAGLPIDRSHDQPGQGHYFTVDRATRLPLHRWWPIERASGG